MADEDNKIIEITPEIDRRNRDATEFYDKNKKFDEYSDDEVHRASFLSSFGEKAEMMNSLELSKTEFPAPEWIVEGIVPEGFSLLAGKQKTGKSFFTLALASAVSTGAPFLNSFKCKKRGVLYISLEENARNVKRRFDAINGLPSENLVFVFDSGGAHPNPGSVPGYLDNYPDTGLIVIDTMGLFLPQFDWNKQEESLETARILKRLSESRGVSILAIVHTRKSDAEDFTDRVSGSTGLTATADSILVLSRRRGNQTGYIEGTGRNILEYEHALRLNTDTGWEYLGTGEEIRQTEDQKLIIGALEEAGEPIGPKDIAAMTGQNYGSVRVLCYRLSRGGLIRKEGYGKYVSV